MTDKDLNFDLETAITVGMMPVTFSQAAVSINVMVIKIK